MLTLLIQLVVAIIIIGLLYWIITLLPIPAPFKNVALALMILILVIFLISTFFGGGWHIRA